MSVPHQRTPRLEGAVNTLRLIHHIEGRNVRPPIPEVIDPYVTLAKHLDDILDPGPEKTTALRKLLESCDAATRCRMSDMENRLADIKVKAVTDTFQAGQQSIVME
jgi:hypothetical protein